jgi:glycosyltransferase involved in cell wall biosynthesis
MKKVVLISSGQPSLNPRLVKEADALADAGYEVTVLYAYWNNWGDDFNKTLFPAKKWNAIIAGGHPVEKPFIYFISRVIYKIAKWLFYKLHFSFCADLAVARSSFFLKTEAKKHQGDIYIGHNIGALSAAVIAAKKNNAKCGFDAEDFHRQEVSDENRSFTFKTYKYIEDKYFSRLNYLTTSSPQIAEIYSKLYPYIKPVAILNVFPKNIGTQQRVINSTGPIKLFWFSQTIGANRGIEDVALALKLLNTTNFEIHLLGHIESEAKQQFLDKVLLAQSNIIFHAPIPSDEIVNFASQFDIGLAIENKTPLNRDICLTNKLFTYMQAGLAIIASDTTAQKCIMYENRAIGQVYQKEDVQSLATILTAYQQDRKMLLDACEASLKLGREKLNWENEGVKFLSLVNNTIKSVE